MSDSLSERMKWAQSKIVMAEAMKLRGSVTVHFSEGIPMSAVMQMNDKPDLDDNVKNT